MSPVHKLRPCRQGTALTCRSIHRLISKLGAEAGFKFGAMAYVTLPSLRPVTATLRVLQVYDDARQDLGGKVAKMVAAGADIGVATPDPES